LWGICGKDFDLFFEMCYDVIMNILDGFKYIILDKAMLGLDFLNSIPTWLLS